MISMDYLILVIHIFLLCSSCQLQNKELSLTVLTRMERSCHWCWTMSLAGCNISFILVRRCMNMFCNALTMSEAMPLSTDTSHFHAQWCPVRNYHPASFSWKIENPLRSNSASIANVPCFDGSPCPMVGGYGGLKCKKKKVKRRISTHWATMRCGKDWCCKYKATQALHLGTMGPTKLPAGGLLWNPCPCAILICKFHSLM